MHYLLKFGKELMGNKVERASRARKCTRKQENEVFFEI